MRAPTATTIAAVLCPALFFCAHSASALVTTCVHNPAELQAALTAAQGSTDQNNIEIARGFYAAGATFAFYSLASTQGQLDVTGGYDSNCTATTQDPAGTILDGGGSNVVMTLESWGGISVRWLTIQNGYQVGNVSGTGGLLVESITGSVIVHYNIIRNNRSNGSFGGMYVATDPANFSTTSTGNMSIWGNLLVDNTAAEQPAGAFLYNSGSGTISVTNNTVANNVLGENGVGLTGGVQIGSTDDSYVSNNILYANTANTYDLFGYGNLVLADNDIGVRGGTIDAGSSGNVSVDPRFSGSADYRLLPTSTLLAIGTLSPGGGLPTIDLEGHARTDTNNHVDPGAYERGDEIYASNFED
jgi:hypothetical protein